MDSAPNPRNGSRSVHPGEGASPDSLLGTRHLLNGAVHSLSEALAEGLANPLANAVGDVLTNGVGNSHPNSVGEPLGIESAAQRALLGERSANGGAQAFPQNVLEALPDDVFRQAVAVPASPTRSRTSLAIRSCSCSATGPSVSPLIWPAKRPPINGRRSPPPDRAAHRSANAERTASRRRSRAACSRPSRTTSRSFSLTLSVSRSSSPSASRSRTTETMRSASYPLPA